MCLAAYTVNLFVFISASCVFVRTSRLRQVCLQKPACLRFGRRKKTLHNGLQTTGFAYNERGWLTNSTSPEFAMQLKYNNAEMGTKPNYNGNISNQLWGTAASLSNTFRYSYDALNRLTDGSTTTVPIQMSELLAYDVMGNIKKLKRDNAPLNEYHYIGNQLQTIDNVTVAAYGYDVNGNATTDGRTGISLGYNYLNLPSTATKTVNGTPVVGLTYTYDATGQKLKKVNSIGVGDTIDYIGGIQYRNGLIDFIQTEEGIARRSGTGYIYEYNLSDHLGNVRYTFRKNPSSFTVEPLQADNYYAFGLRKPFLVGSTDNKYLYNGKELQEELGQYDYGARFYDPVVGRWNTVDPLAEKMSRYSPYVYCFNNPILFVDPDGMRPEWIKGTDGKRVNYTINKDNSVSWSKNASADTRRVGNALVANGDKALLKMVNDANYSVKFDIDPSVHPTKLGNAINTYDLKTGAVLKSEITLYEGGLKKMENSVNNGMNMVDVATGQPSEQTKLYTEVLKSGNFEGAIAADAAHEIIHSADKSNTDKQFKNAFKNGKFDVEAKPEATETQSLRNTVIKQVIKDVIKLF